LVALLIFNTVNVTNCVSCIVFWEKIKVEDLLSLENSLYQYTKARSRTFLNKKNVFDVHLNVRSFVIFMKTLPVAASLEK